MAQGDEPNTDPVLEFVQRKLRILTAARAALPALRHHGRPFFGEQHACAPCSMGRPCLIKDLVKELIADEQAQNDSSGDKQ